MMRVDRRQFLESVAAAGVAAFAGIRSLQAADALVDVNPSQPGPAISPHLYGHFIEHLGGVIYDGIWVGPNSTIPNIGGIRKQFVNDMRRIGAPNLRWPSGCFADGYHWRDGIGAGKRPRTYNYWENRMPAGLHSVERNEFGFHEFMRLCRLVGAEPYVAANVGSGTPQEFHDWVSYSNAPAGTISLADERASNGEKAPFNIKYWGVGNESWGCGGNMSGGEYASAYRRFISQCPVYVPTFFVATGPRGHSTDGDVGWTETFFAGLKDVRGLGVRVDGFALHYYTDFRQTAEDGARFDAKGWYAVLHKGASLQDGVATRIRVSGGAGLREARATVLTHEDMHATNTFQKPEEVRLAGLEAHVSGDTATVTIPKHAVVAVSLQLA